MVLPNCYQKCQKVPKSAVLFFCNYCDYTTSHKSHYNKHLLTIKHKKKVLPKCYQKVPKSAKKFSFASIATKNIRAEKVYGVIRKNVPLTLTLVKQKNICF